MEDRPIGKSLDPRMNRLPLVPADQTFLPAEDLDQFQTFQVFHQARRGDQHTHVGIVHAPNPEMALLYAKEQYTRRGQCVNLWVVRTADVFASDYEDDDIFLPATNKDYREAYFYKNREVIEEFKRRMDSIADKHFRLAHEHEETTVVDTSSDKPVVIKKAKGATIVRLKGEHGATPTIIVGKKR